MAVNYKKFMRFSHVLENLREQEQDDNVRYHLRTAATALNLAYNAKMSELSRTFENAKHRIKTASKDQPEIVFKD